MKHALIYSFLLLNVSCGHFLANKQMGKKYIKSRYVDVHGNMRYKNIAFYYVGGKNISCFEDNDEREVITTDRRYFEYVVNHFYERQLEVDIVSTRHNGTYDIAKAHYYEKFNFTLETATCFIHFPYDPTYEKLVISFRRARDQKSE